MPASDLQLAPLPDSAINAAPDERPLLIANRVRGFYELTKPRMNLLVLVTTAVGYYMAAGATDWPRFIATMLGTALTAAAASAFNQLIEREHDSRMPRTAGRPLPSGAIAPAEAFWFGLLLAICGVLTLACLVNFLTAGLGLFTLLSYDLIYTPMKRSSSLNTVVGAIPGAIPPVMGFTAVHNGISPEALALFGILFIWQIPHFLAIAVLYRTDYAAGGFRMLPVIDPELRLTSRVSVLNTIALVPVTLLPYALRMAGPAYFVAAVVLGGLFIHFAIKAARSRSRADARRLFFASIIHLPLLLGFMVFDRVV